MCLALRVCSCLCAFGSECVSVCASVCVCVHVSACLRFSLSRLRLWVGACGCESVRLCDCASQYTVPLCPCPLRWLVYPVRQQVSLSGHLRVCVFVCVCSSVCRCVFFPACLFACVCGCGPLRVHVSVRRCVCVSVCLRICVSVRLFAMLVSVSAYTSSHHISACMPRRSSQVLIASGGPHWVFSYGIIDQSGATRMTWLVEDVLEELSGPCATMQIEAVLHALLRRQRPICFDQSDASHMT